MAVRISRLIKFPQSQEAVINKSRSPKDAAIQGSGRRRHPRDFWQQKVEEFNGAGLSARKFSALHGVAYSTFCRWKQSFIISKKALSPNKPPEAPEFISVLLDPLAEGFDQDLAPQKACKTEPITLHFGGNIHLAIPKGFDGPTLERMVQILWGQH
jgi:hypothetical protein